MKKDVRLELIEAIEKISFLPKVSTRILVVLAKHNAPLPTSKIASMAAMCAPHAHFVLNKLLKQKVISKAQTLFPSTNWVINKNWKNKILTLYKSTSLFDSEDN